MNLSFAHICNFIMFELLAISSLLVHLVLASEGCKNETTDTILTVSTRTGTFVGNLNDTYPDVRQFKYIPYAKVLVPHFHSPILTTPSHRLETSAGHLHNPFTTPQESTTQQSLVPPVHNTSPQSPQFGL